ncbi:hypothetical protein GLDPPO_GLDPPO_05655, partial [Dysosmobacter welbionis]
RGFRAASHQTERWRTLCEPLELQQLEHSDGRRKIFAGL